MTKELTQEVEEIVKEELTKLWAEYNEDCKKKERAYFESVVEHYGGYMYAPSKANKPTFEGFMKWIATPLPTKQVKK